MKKIKNFYKTHRVFMILMAVSLVCLIVIGTILIKCFYVSGDNDKYGNRLENIDDYPLEESRLKEIELKLSEDEKIENVSILVTGRIVYVHIYPSETGDLETSQGVAIKLLEEFTAEEKQYYDYQFTIKKDATETSEAILVSGAHNKSGSGLNWNNMRVVPEETPAEGTEES